MKIARDLFGHFIEVPEAVAAQIGLREGDDVTVRATPEGEMEIVRLGGDGSIVEVIASPRRTVRGAEVGGMSTQ